MDDAHGRALADILRRAGEVMFPDVDNPTVDVFTKDSDGDTALHKAAFWGGLAGVEALLAAGARVDEPGDMGCAPLYNAVLQGHENVVIILLSHGANPDAVNEFGTTPRALAARSPSQAIRGLFERHKPEK